MDNRLDRLLNGQFDHNTSHMLLSGRRISLQAKAGENAKGAFLITHPEEGRIRGFLSTADPRILLPVREFNGHENLIRFEVSTRGMVPGESSEGTIGISTDLGEETVTVVVTAGKEETEQTLSLDSLAAEAERDFEHTSAIFSTGAFRKQVISSGSPSDIALYESLFGDKDPNRRLEEFLVGSGRKESVDITADWTSLRIRDPESTMRQTIVLTAGCRGYLEIEISSDARFLRPEKKRFTTLDFVGNTYRTGLIIDANFLHAGKNYGRVLIRTPYRTLELYVRADKTSDEEERRLHRVRSLMVKKAMNLYLDYRTGKMDLHNWSERTESVLGAYRRAGGRDVYADLVSVFVLQADGKRREAERLLGGLEKTPDRFTSPDRYAFLLFLTTFFTRDMDYINSVRTHVRQLSAENPSDWRIFWVCLYLLDSGSGEETKRYEAVKRQIRLGCNSPVIYLEGALLLRQNPYLLHELTPETKQILNFASRRDLLTEQLYLKAASEEKRHPHYDPVMYRTLQRCRVKTGARDILEALCAMAIAGGKKDRSFFPLYRVAVTQELSVNGLYEYYMEAMDECRIETMPEIIRRYFLYNDTLDYHKKARIFRNMSDSRRQIPGIFRSMTREIIKFAVDQLAQEHIDNDLAVLYEEFLDKSILTRRLAKNLLRILFTYRVDCLRPDMKRIILADSRYSEEKAVEIKKQAALVRIFSDETRILLEDGDGKRYASTSLYMTDHYLESPKLLQLCMSIIPDAEEFVLFHTLNTAGNDPVDRDNLRFFLKATHMNGLTDAFRQKVRLWILDFYASGQGDDSLDHFLGKIDPAEYAKADVAGTQKLLVEKGYYEEAYRLVKKFGHDHTPVNLLVRICSQMVPAADYEEDEVLLELCAFCFFSGKYDVHILAYLAMYADGLLPQLLSIWEAAREYGLDTMRLEEKILSLAVFEGDANTSLGKVLESYRKKQGSRKLCRAVTILASCGCFVRDNSLSEEILADMLADERRNISLPDVCGLAILKTLSARDKLTEDESSVSSGLLEYFEDKGICFSFFARYPENMHSDCGILEKTFFEYKASPGSTVVLNFRRKDSGEGYTEETMKECFGGIFVREFVLFPGEELECFTEERRKDGTRILSGIRTLTADPHQETDPETRHGKLAALSRALESGDLARAKELLDDIRQTDAFAKQVFTLV